MGEAQAFASATANPAAASTQASSAIYQTSLMLSAALAAALVLVLLDLGLPMVGLVAASVATTPGLAAPPSA